MCQVKKKQKKKLNNKKRIKLNINKNKTKKEDFIINEVLYMYLKKIINSMENIKYVKIIKKSLKLFVLMIYQKIIQFL